jgi:hypothetical protein
VFNATKPMETALVRKKVSTYVWHSTLSARLDREEACYTEFLRMDWALWYFQSLLLTLLANSFHHAIVAAAKQLQVLPVLRWS